MTSTTVVNYYEILGISNDATTKDINSAYKRLALKHHPDKAGGSDESVDEFRKIQQAVETLRDPSRRRIHDAHLTRQKKLDDHVLFSASYHGWRPQNPFWYNMRNSNARYMYSYANSVHMDPFSNESREEREKCEADVRFGEEIRREQEEEERREEERERVRVRESVEEERARFESVRFGFGRCGFGGPGFQSPSFERADFGSANFESAWREQNEGGYTQMEDEYCYEDWNVEDTDEQHPRDYGEWDGAEDEQGEDQQFEDGDEALHHDNGSDQGHDCKDMGEGIHLDEDKIAYDKVKPDEACDDSFSPETTPQQSYEDNAAAENYTFQDPLASEEYGESDERADKDNPATEDNTFQEIPVSEDSDRPDEFDERTDEKTTGGTALSETDKESTVFYDCHSDQDSFTDAHSQVSGSSSRRTSSIPQPSASKIPSEQINPYIAPFIPYFNAKLNHSSGRYTQDDMQVELQGIVMETFCGWLEGVRQTFSLAKPLPVEESQDQCLHLGPWEKEYEHAECEACHRWMPIYTLTCPGCGCKACVGCKFEGYDNK